MSSEQEQFYGAKTYEATKAQEWNAQQADKIHWERDAAYRNQAYRHLHHQNGLIGTFQIRLLEAADLKRSYWSALAVGPLTLFGLSKAHGAVSSFVSFGLDRSTPSTGTNLNKHEDTTMSLDSKKPAATVAAPPPPCFVSPVNPQDDNPVWNNCHFDMKLGKGALKDGQPIRLQVRVDEDSTAVENLFPGVKSGGDSRLLGVGHIDLTSLCLGQVVATGQPQVGVLDAWVPIYLNSSDNTEAVEGAFPEGFQRNSKAQDPLKKPSAEKSLDKTPTGRVRVLVSYQPYGMEPQPHDIVALEAFARQDPRAASCRPVLPPLLPLHVLETSGPWLLVEYPIRPTKKACLRLHRNAVFCLERKNNMDKTLNLAMLPTDIFLSTALGRGTQELVGPLFVASRQLLMPALLSAKLVWMAIRTTALASLTGVQAVTSTFINEGSTSLTQDGEDRRRKPDGSYKFITL